MNCVECQRELGSWKEAYKGCEVCNWKSIDDGEAILYLIDSMGDVEEAVVELKVLLKDMKELMFGEKGGD